MKIKLLFHIFLFCTFIGLSNAEVSLTFMEACQIRDEVALRCDWGSETQQIGMGVFKNNWAEIEKIIDSDKYALMCQGTAYALHMKYIHMGVRSYLVGFSANGLTHSVVLVEISYENSEKKLIIVDPSFNVSYVDKNGKPLSIF